jgi:hypothetical protein
MEYRNEFTRCARRRRDWRGTLPSVGDEANTQQPTPGASFYIASRYATRRDNFSGEPKKIFPRRLRSAPALCHSLIRRLV